MRIPSLGSIVSGGLRSSRRRLTAVTTLLVALGGFVVAHAQNRVAFDPTANMSPLEHLAWDASFMVTPSSAGDPLQPVDIIYAQSYPSPDVHAQRVPQLFQEARRNGHIPFIFIEANIRPRNRRDLVPVMLVGDLGLFTDRSVPVALHHPLERLIRAKAAMFPGGTFRMNGAPVVLGGRDDLIRRLEAKDAERDEDEMITRASNKAKFSTEQRHIKVIDQIESYLFSSALGRHYLDKHVFQPAPSSGPEDVFKGVRIWEKRQLAQGMVPLVFAPADTPKSAMDGFVPLARIGDWGAWGSPETPAAEVSQMAQVFVAKFKDDEFRDFAASMSVTEFGGADDLRQLVARTQERPAAAKPVAAAPAPASAPVAKPAATPGVVVTYGPKVVTTIPDSSQDVRKDPPIPPVMRSMSGPKGLTCIDNLGQGWTGVSAQDKAKHEHDQAEFKKLMNAKLAKIEELKKQKAKEDAARWDNNMKILKAWIKSDEDKITALDARMREKLRSEGSRSDAVTYVVREVNGFPSIILTNHTSVALYVTFDYNGTVDGKPITFRGSDWTILTSGYEETRTLTALIGVWEHKLAWTADDFHVQWEAREQDNKWRN